MPRGFDVPCDWCGRPTTYQMSEHVLPPGSDPEADGIRVCPRCLDVPGMVRLEWCDSCGAYRPLDGGFAGQVPVSMDGDMVTVFWECRSCREQGRVRMIGI